MDVKLREIKDRLIEFQCGYEKGKAEQVEDFVREFFLDEEDTSFVGTGALDWNFGIEEISKAIRNCWTKDEEYLKNIKLDIDNSVITIDGDTAAAAVCGSSTAKLDSNSRFNNMLMEIKNGLRVTDNTKLELMNVSQRISRMFYEIELGENYVWPFRTTFFMIKKEARWLFKHVHLSFGANNGWEAWFTDENIPCEYKYIATNSMEGAEVDKIRKILCTIQEGYKKRDISYLENFTNEVFSKNESNYIFGTDEGENFIGSNAGYELTEGDWKYWGNFDINPAGAYIYIHGNMAFVYSKAFLRDEHDIQDEYNSLGDLFHNYILPEDAPSVNKLLRMLWKTTNRVYNAEHGGKYICPMKFIGVLIKSDDNWRFQHMHFSDNIDGMPEERTL